MTSYFKHTYGEAYTLKGQDYVGFFHIIGGTPYTGKEPSDDSEELTPKDTFIANFYQNLGNFNTVYKSIDGIKSYYSNVFDIFNKQGIDSALTLLNDNNLNCFKGIVLANPVVYNAEENNNFYYGLSSPTDNLYGIYTSVNVDDFSESEKWSFLDNVITGALTTDTRDNFKYFCSTGTEFYVLSGNFSSGTALEIINYQNLHPFPPPDGFTPDYIHHIYHDVDNQQMFFVKNSTIEVYDTSNYDDCNNLILIDIINLKTANTYDYIWGRTNFTFGEIGITFGTKYSTNNPNNPEYIKFGKNVRTGFSGNTLFILNKYSSETLNEIDLSSYDIDQIMSIDIRNTDDNIIILYKSQNDLRLLFIDPQTETITDSSIKSINDSSKYTVKFSTIDSDMFYISHQDEYQTRFLSKPTYPAGRIELGDLFYPERYIWGTANVQFQRALGKWESGSQPSNRYTNLLATEIIKNDKMYMLLHNIGRLYALSQPTNDRFLNAIPLNTVSYYEDSICSESTLGLYFNSAITSIVKDVLNLYINAYGSFNIHERLVITKKLQDLVSTTNDLYINGNETFNVTSIQRIFVLINEMQSALLPESVEN